MPSQTPIEFISLFVPDLDNAAAVYEAVFGAAPLDEVSDVPSPHPFAARGPVVFRLGSVNLAIYQADGRITHPGDVGIGVRTDSSPHDAASRAEQHGARVFRGKKPMMMETGREELVVFMLPDRHFFEVLGPADD